MFPSVLNTFNRPTPTDRLNAPSHSALHNTVSSVLGQVQAVIGLSTSSLVGTLFYDVRSPDSNGGGHVQTAVKGGTGQTTFTKGDTFVATGPSTISKLAVGVNGQAIVADSTTAAGIKYGAPALTRIHSSVLSSIIGQGVVTETSIFSVAIPGSTLGTNNAVRATVNVQEIDFSGTTASVMLRGIYGGARVASVLLQAQDLGGGAGLKGKFEFTLFGDGLVNAQSGDLHVSLAKNLANQSSVTGNFNMDTGLSSVASGASQNLGMTARYSVADSNNQLRIKGIIIEKIV